MAFSDKYELYFVHIAKNAGTSIIESFNMKEHNHRNWRQHKNIHSKRWKNYLKFAVVRNPWDRVVSNYEYLQMDKNYWHSKDGSTPHTMHKDYYILKNESFGECVDLLCNTNKLKHAGWKPQYWFICDKYGKIKVDLVFKYENLKSDISYILNLNNIDDFELKEINPSKRKKDYKEYYNNKTRNMITEYYKKDIKIFNYGWE